MDRFIMHHRHKIVGTLSCFDRVIFKGHLPISHPTGMENWMSCWASAHGVQGDRARGG